MSIEIRNDGDNKNMAAREITLRKYKIDLTFLNKMEEYFYCFALLLVYGYANLLTIPDIY